MMMTPFVLEFSLQSVQLTSRMHPQGPTNHVLSTFSPLGPTCCGTVLVYVEMPKNLILRLGKSPKDIVFGAPSYT
jgi:hypothetical protein